MSLPYDPATISSCLRRMTSGQVAAAHPHHFQTWPAVKITPAPIIAELIANERANRSNAR